MTQKDFQLIAQTLRSATKDYAEVLQSKRVGLITKDQQAALAAHFADALAATNPAFNRALFIQAATGVVPVNARHARCVCDPRDFTACAVHPNRS